MDAFKREWKRRKIRNVVHLTVGGCLGPCVVANVVLLVFDGRSVWFHSITVEPQVLAIYDYVDEMLAADRFLPPPAVLVAYVFEGYAWPHTTSAADAVPPSVSPDAPTSGLVILTHADTDLLTVARAQSLLPPELPSLTAVSLRTLQTPEHTDALIDGPLASARTVILRVLGDPGTIPGFGRLTDVTRRRGQRLIALSGTTVLDPTLTAASTVDPATLHQVVAYFDAGGADNVAQMARFLSDTLDRTGFGFLPPVEHPRHGIYHPALSGTVSLDDWRTRSDPTRPTVAILFYRAHVLSGNLEFVDAFVRALDARGANALPVFTASLKEEIAAGWPAAVATMCDAGGSCVADVVVSTMAMATGSVDPDGPTARGRGVDAFDALDVPVLQAIPASTTRWQWELSSRGLSPVDLAMHVVLPEFDGRITTVPISFKTTRPGVAPLAYEPATDRIGYVVDLALRFAALRRKPNADKRVAFVLTNTAGKAGRIGGAVGLDTPASLLRLLHAMQAHGYRVDGLPADGDTLMHELIDRGTYDETVLTDDQLAHAVARVPTDQYAEWFADLPPVARQSVIAQWGEPPGDAYVHDGAIALAGLDFGHAFVALQPPRGHGMDAAAIYHTPTLPPPHYYVALYHWLRDVWGADAIVHVGKHGTLEWLPGKSIGLSSECFPETVVGDLPVLYPFIINDPGEGAQAKRRSHAVIVDHLTPPLTTADGYGELAQLAQLVDEYYQVELLDPTKLPLLQQQIWTLVTQARLDRDLALIMGQDDAGHGHIHEWDDKLTPEGTPVTLTKMGGRDVAHLVENLDAYLCELTSAQIRDGLHVLGVPPSGQARVELLRALTRLPNGTIPSLRAATAQVVGLDYTRALAGLGVALPDPLPTLTRLADRPLITHADAVEAVDEMIGHLLSLLEDHEYAVSAIDSVMATAFTGCVLDTDAAASVRETLQFVCMTIVPALAESTTEIDHILRALSGGYVPAGPSGAPSRGMVQVLPTGRNFYALDPRTVPSIAAWDVGQALAREVLERYVRETGAHPESVGVSAWGTSAMRTHGDDVAEILALLGVRPVRQSENHRVTGIEIVPLDELARPRIDVVIRISGFFRDAFPHLITLMDDAVRTVARLDEDPERNFVRKHYLQDLADATATGVDAAVADRAATYRVFGSPPGAYGAGIQPLLDERNWHTDTDLADVYVNWGGYAYGADTHGVDARDVFRARLGGVEVAIHNQDNREHDIFDNDDYLQFHGGMIATIRALTGRQPSAYFGDAHDPARPAVRDLRAEALRVFRARVVNPKWLESITRHGYKGGLELAATVDYLFGYDATAGVVEDWMYERVAGAYALDQAMRDFFAASNPWALHALTERLLEAIDRGLWVRPEPGTEAALRAVSAEADGMLESRGTPMETARVT